MGSEEKLDYQGFSAESMKIGSYCGIAIGVDRGGRGDLTEVSGRVWGAERIEF